MISGAHVEEHSSIIRDSKEGVRLFVSLDHNICIKYSQETVLHIKQNFQTERVLNYKSIWVFHIYECLNVLRVSVTNLRAVV